MKKQNPLLLIACLCGMTLLFAGCATQKTSQPAENSQSLGNPMTAFEDIEVPADMKFDQKQSIQITTESFRGGALYLSGKVEVNSLRDFLVASMKNNKWQHVGEVYSDRMMLAFVKPNKTCIVMVKEGFGGSLGTTYMEMYVTVDVKAGLRLNPFGEPVSQ
jgi:hypothetical protein